MYSRHDTRLVNQEFWTVFGQYMSPVPSRDGERINWLNYKTGLKSMHIRLNVDSVQAEFCIELTHKVAAQRRVYFNQFRALKPVFERILPGGWHWNENALNEGGMTTCKIGTVLPNVSVFNKHQWPAIISFFKNNLVNWDEFWSGFKYSFESLE